MPHNVNTDSFRSRRTVKKPIGSENLNPEFREALPDFKQMHDTSKGEREIKERTIDYLPKTGGQENDLQEGEKRYTNYLHRSVYYGYVGDTIISMLGIMYSEKPTAIELPARIEDMILNATPAGSTLVDVGRRTNNEQLTFGRYGLLLDIPATTETLVTPVIIEYPWNCIINWNFELENGVRTL